VAPSDGQTNSTCSKVDVLIPKPLESDVVLDVVLLLLLDKEWCLHGVRNSVGALVMEVMQI
jgi:hypothetical protein